MAQLAFALIRPCPWLSSCAYLLELNQFDSLYNCLYQVNQWSLSNMELEGRIAAASSVGLSLLSL